MPRATSFVRVPHGEWIDLYEEYGVSLSETALSRLMTPTANKEYTENESALQHGKRVIRDVTVAKKKDRSFTLELNVYGRTQNEFLVNFAGFCAYVLDKGFFDLKTIYQPNVVYRLTYLDCTQFEEYNRRVGKFALNVNEPDPTNRGEYSTEEWEDYEPTH